MKDYGSWAQGFWSYEQLRVVDDKSYSNSWAHVSKWYEELRFMDDMGSS